MRDTRLPGVSRVINTTRNVDLAIQDMAAEMARLLLDRIGGQNGRVTSVVFEPTLVVRQSA